MNSISIVSQRWICNPRIALEFTFTLQMLDFGYNFNCIFRRGSLLTYETNKIAGFVEQRCLKHICLSTVGKKETLLWQSRPFKIQAHLWPNSCLQALGNTRGGGCYAVMVTRKTMFRRDDVAVTTLKFISILWAGRDGEKFAREN